MNIKCQKLADPTHQTGGQEIILRVIMLNTDSNTYYKFLRYSLDKSNVELQLTIIQRRNCMSPQAATEVHLNEGMNQLEFCSGL